MASNKKETSISIDDDIINAAWLAFGRFTKKIWHEEKGNPLDTRPDEATMKEAEIRFRAGERAKTKEEIEQIVLKMVKELEESHKHGK